MEGQTELRSGNVFPLETWAEEGGAKLIAGGGAHRREPIRIAAAAGTTARRQFSDHGLSASRAATGNLLIQLLQARRDPFVHLRDVLLEGQAVGIRPGGCSPAKGIALRRVAQQALEEVARHPLGRGH